MKTLLLLFAITLSVSVLAQGQSGYGGDGKANSGATGSSFIKLYETLPTAPTLAAGAAGITTTGAHKVAITCYNGTGETSSGTASAAVDTATAQFSISAIPVCSNLATGRKVYINTVAAPTSFYLVATLADNTTTTYTYNNNDAVIAGGAAIPTSNTMYDARLTIGQNGPVIPSTSLFAMGTTTSHAAIKTSSGALGAQMAVRTATDSGALPVMALGFLHSGGVIAMIAGELEMGTSGVVNWTNAAAWSGGTRDTGMKRADIGVIAATNGTSGTGWFQNSGGEGALTAAFTNATTTFASSNLSYTVVAGRSYRIHGILAIANSTAGHGVKLDFNGGSATATTFFATATVKGGGTATAGTLISTSLAGVLNYTSVTSTVYVEIDGYLLVNGAGTFILRAAEDSTGGASASLGVGSWIALSDTVVK